MNPVIDADDRDMGAHVGLCRRRIYPWSDDDSARFGPCSCDYCLSLEAEEERRKRSDEEENSSDRPDGQHEP